MSAEAGVVPSVPTRSTNRIVRTGSPFKYPSFLVR
jgi:hypothetical protein